MIKNKLKLVPLDIHVSVEVDHEGDQLVLKGAEYRREDLSA
jgi:hypothetical protein